MCLSIAIKRPNDVLAHGKHCGHEFMVIHNRGGSRCGYVKVEPGHPWYGKKMDDIGAEVHGGVTFSEPDESCDKGGPDNGWWVGFDTAHYSDAPDPNLPGHHHDHDGLLMRCYFGGEVRSQEYVEAECRSLCEQAYNAASSVQSGDQHG